MKKLPLVFLLMVLAFGLGVIADSTLHPKTVHAQSSANTLTCNMAGVSTPCSQYVVQINSARGFGRFVVYQAASPIDTSQMVKEGAGNPAFTLNAFEPDPRGTSTFTMALGEP